MKNFSYLNTTIATLNQMLTKLQFSTLTNIFYYFVGTVNLQIHNNSQMSHFKKQKFKNCGIF